MTDRQSNDSTSESDGLAQLLKAAGRRAAPPAEARQAVLDAATAAWRQKVQGQRRRRRLVGGAVAAALVVAASWFALFRVPAPLVEVASADRIVGRVEWRAPAASRWSPLRADGGDALGIGSRVRTGDHSFAGLRLANGSSLRVAPHSELLFAAGREISLTSGTLYVDSGSAGTSTGSPFEVVTPAGRAVEIGTQYSVSYDADSGYVLRVREGRVRLLRGTGIIESIAGEMLRIDAVGQVEQDTVTPTSKTWQWTQIVAPVPDIEAQPVTRLLDWVTRETGFGLRYASPATRERATRTLLHGDIGTLTPIDALDVLLATTDLQYTLLDDGTIEVGARTAD